MVPPLHVLYEDNHLIAVVKPAGVLTQGDVTGEPSLMDHVKDWLRAKYQKPGNVFLGLLHRLDREVAGVILFAKTSKGASRLSAQIRERRMEKIYGALVEGQPPDQGELRGTVDGKEARLSYRVIARRPPGAILEVNLETGRKHQIRIQLSEAGFPIAGDARYGAKTAFEAGGIALVARRLRFAHATDPGREVVVELPAGLDPLRS
jgi:23S rRNA pseudouridine1911/1915/1917 synthase